jgi:hypothetical protein
VYTVPQSYFQKRNDSRESFWFRDLEYYGMSANCKAACLVLFLLISGLGTTPRLERTSFTNFLLVA